MRTKAEIEKEMKELGVEFKPVSDLFYKKHKIYEINYINKEELLPYSFLVGTLMKGKITAEAHITEIMGKYVIVRREV